MIHYLKFEIIFYLFIIIFLIELQLGLRFGPNSKIQINTSSAHISPNNDI